MRESLGVRKAKKADAHQLASFIPTEATLHDVLFVFKVKLAAQLKNDERARIWQIVDSNMRDIASKSSMGWKPTQKKKELFSTKSRFILVYQSQGAKNAGDNNLGDLKTADIVGFVMFRFEHEEGEDLVYCYEVQMCDEFRSHGVGHLLLRSLVDIGLHWGMDKIMLIFMTGNPRARVFYGKHGFVMDPCSPDYVNKDEGEEEEGKAYCDYEILSRVL
ncbi:acyl-CoA N-acyltransferase [Abortiporus biennis]|nr:acyl-CoA N-acyltransferase [Abortiporus biennis]